MELAVLAGLIVVLLVGAYLVVLPILVFTAQGRLTRLEKEAEDLRREVASLSARVSAQTAQAVRPAGQPTSASAAPAPTVAAPPRAPAPSAPVASPSVVAPPVPAVPMPSVAPPASPARASAPATTPAQAATQAPPALRKAPTPPRPPAPPMSPPIPPVPPSSGGGWGGDLRGFNWESLVGVKLFSAIAGIALVFAAVFFLRFSVEHGYLQPPVRVAIGVIVGVSLLIACELRAANQYRVTANALDASGVSILFSTFFAAYALWHLIPAWLTFLLLIIVTALAVLLSVRRASVFIAVLGLLGGFAAPALLSSGQNNPLGLFGYLLLLNAGLAWIAHTKRWPIIRTLTLVLTTIYQWAWVIKFLDAASLPLAAGIFLIFPVLTLLMTTIGERYLDANGGGRGGAGGTARPFGDTPGVSALLPFLLAVYLAAVPQYGGRYGVLFGFLFLIDVGLFVVAMMRRAAALQFVGGATTLMVFAVWFGYSYGGAAWPVALGIVAAFALLYLLMSVLATSVNRPFEGVAARTVYTAPLLLAAFPVIVAIEPLAMQPLLPFGVLALLLVAMATYAVARGESGVYFVAAFFAIVAELFWSGRYLTPGRLYNGLLVYFVFAAIFIAVPSVARRVDRTLPPRSGWPAAANLALSLIGHLFLFIVAVNPALSTPPWPLFAVLFVLGLALLAAALDQRRGELQIGGMIASALVLFAWSVSVHAMPWSLVAVIVALALPAYAILALLLASRVAFVERGFLVGVAIANVGGQFVMMSAAGARETPAVSLLIAANVVLLGTMLVLAARERERWPWFPWVPLVTTTLVNIAWRESPLGGWWQMQLALPVAIWACFVAFPLLLRQRVGRAMEPYRVAVLASVPFFFFARQALIDGGFTPVIGALPVAQALVLLTLLVQLLRLEPPGARALGRLALVAGAALAFVTLAIPLQLDKQWLTVAWALEAAALAWLYGRVPHRGLLMTCAGLLGIVFVRLALNPQVFVYAPRSSVRIFNWYLYAYLISAACCFVAARLLARTEDQVVAMVPRVSRVLPALGTVLLFLLLNIEIADYYAIGPTLTFRFSATLAQDLTYTLGWGAFAIGLLVVGIRGRVRNVRLASIGLLLVTVLKCFLHDLGRLGGLYLVASFVGLAICLALVALALQRFVLAQPQDAL